MLFLFLFSFVAQAAPLLDPKASYETRAEVKGAAPGFRALGDHRFVSRVEVQSFEEGQKDANMSSDTDQELTVKELSRDRRQVSFERFSTVSKVRLPGSPKPFELKQDFGAALRGQPFVLVYKSGEVEKVEGLAKVRAGITKSADAVTRQTLLQVMNEDIVKTTMAGIRQDGFCLAGLKGRKVGDSWSGARTTDGTKTEFTCVFDGWAEAKGKKVAVITVTVPPQMREGQGMIGQKFAVESRGSGRLLLEPEARETLLSMTMEMHTQPPAEEVARLTSAGKPVSRTRSVLRSWAHHFADTADSEASPDKKTKK